MSDPLGCAVVGLGWMGGIRADAIARLPGLRLVACMDAASEAADRCPPGVEFTTDALAAIERPDVQAVFVCTPDGAHRDAAVAALEAGRHVFCEKPLATSLEDADAILDAAARSDVTFAVGQTVRADGRFAVARERVAAGAVGAPLHCFSRRGWPAAEGRRMSRQTTLPLYLSVHDFDALQWIVGSPIVRVSGEAASVSVAGIDGPATCVASLRFANGAVGLHEVSWGLPDQAGLALGACGLTVVGTAGYLDVEAGTDGVTLLGGPEAAAPEAPSLAFRTRGLVEFPAQHVPDVGLPTGLYAIEVASFARAVRDGAQPLASGADGRAAMAAALAFEQSITMRAPADVDVAAGVRA